MYSLIERRGANSTYFFKYAHETEDTTWIPLLEERGYFANPPSVEQIGDGTLIFPFWWPMRYLKKMCKYAPNKVIDIVTQLAPVDNPWIYNEILEIALHLHGEQSARLKAKIIESSKLKYQFWAHQYPNLLAYWMEGNQISAALEVTKGLVEFAPDPDSVVKCRCREENPKNPLTLLEPLPQIDPSRSDSGVYCEMMSKGVRPLIKKAPYEVALILIDATTDMIRLRTHQEDCNDGVDYSEAWCERISVTEGDYDDPTTALIHTLTFTCEQVYRKFPEVICELDNILRDQKWKVFNRLRHHLYAQFPKKTKPWIREVILAHEGYNHYEHPYEFQQMIQNACKYFGASLLTEKELARIFAKIRSGPSRDCFRNWIGDEFTEQRFQERKRNFHRMQFKPFASVLIGEYETYFSELEAEAEDQISDDDYPPLKLRSGYVFTRSPRSPEDLANLPDEELLAYVNAWNKDDQLFEGNNLIEVDIRGLSAAFQTVFKEKILLDPDRFGFWIENCGKINRVAYLEAMIGAMRECVETRNFENLNQWISFCVRILLHSDAPLETDSVQDNEFQKQPEWHDFRKAVGYFLRACLEKEVPVFTRVGLATLLDVLCTRFDPHLDQNIKGNNLIDTAIHSTRGSALEDLVKFGFWLRKHDARTEVTELRTILEKRFAPTAEYPLTLPEYAILGTKYKQIFDLDAKWTSDHKSDFSPRGDFQKWLAAFENFVLYNGACEATFETLRDDYDFALQHLNDVKRQTLPGEKRTRSLLKPDRPEDRFIYFLGKHLFAYYYLWNMYTLRGEDSLLERYYQRTANNRKHWINLFEHVGRILGNTVGTLDKCRKDRIIVFFDWRYEVGDPTEFQQFRFWLRAKCLDPQWRLDSCSMVLKICKEKNVPITVPLDTFCEMLPDHTAQVVHCLAQITDGIRGDTIHTYKDYARTILRTALASTNDTVRQNAVDACENLIRDGKTDFSDLLK